MARAKARRAMNIKEQLQNQSVGTAMGAGTRLHPNHAINSIVPTPTNPRRQDLDAAGVTIDVVKKIGRKVAEQEAVDAFEQRMRDWIDASYTDEGNRNVWLNLLSLSLSIIRQGGVLQPVTLRVEDPDNYQTATLIAGERRFLASALAGFEAIDAIVKTTVDASLYEGMVENTQRDDLSLNAVIGGLRAIEDEEGRALSVREIAHITGQSRGSAGVIRKVLQAEPDHPAIQALTSGTATRVYHLQQLLTPETPDSTTDSDSTAMDGDGHNHSGSDNGASTDNTNTQQGETAPDTDERPNLDTDPSGENAANASSSAGKSAKQTDWGAIQQWLIEQAAPDDPALRERIESINSAKALTNVLEDLASRSRGA